MSKDFDNMLIEELHLGSHIYNTLRRAYIHTVGDILKRTDDQLSMIKGMGPDSLKRLKRKLIEIGAIKVKDDIEENDKIEQLGLNSRAYNALKRAGINRISELQRLGAFELSSFGGLAECGIAEVQEKLRNYKSKQEGSLEDEEKLEDMLIGKVGFDGEIYNVLQRANIQTIGQLTSKTCEEIAKIRGIGPKNLKRLKERLKEFAGIELLSIRDVPDQIEQLGMHNRISQALRRAGICTISELRSLTRERLLDINGIGIGTLEDIESALAQHEQEITQAQSGEETELIRLKSTKAILEQTNRGIIGETRKLAGKIKTWGDYEAKKTGANLQQ